MKKVIDGNVLVIRGGKIKEKNFLEGAKVDTRDLLSGLSVQLSIKTAKKSRKDKVVMEMLEEIPNSDYMITSAKHIMKAKGEIFYDPKDDNKFHGIINGITTEDLVRIFKAF